MLTWDRQRGGEVQGGLGVVVVLERGVARAPGQLSPQLADVRNVEGVVVGGALLCRFGEQEG